MTPERWAQIYETLEAVLEVEPSKVQEFLEERCAGDDERIRIVQSMLESLARRGKAFDLPAPEIMFQDMAHDPQKPMLETGQELGDRYQVCDMLGKGGFAEVYKAKDKRLKRYVAIKIFSPSPENKSADALRRFTQESVDASSLGHPNIVVVYDVGEHEVEGERATPFIVTEFIEGMTLRQRLKQSQIGLTEALEIAMQLTSALRATHEKGIVHRDIKPENILLSSDGTVKIFDFGVAKATRKEIYASESHEEGREATKSGAIIGSNKYMSPEQLRALRDVDTRSDIWAVGVVLYEMIAGRVPFDGPNRDVVSHRILSGEKPVPLPGNSPAIRHKLNRFVFKALSRDREKRYQTVQGLSHDLQGLKLHIDRPDWDPKAIILRFLRTLRAFLRFSNSRTRELLRAARQAVGEFFRSVPNRKDSEKSQRTASENPESVLPVVRTHRPVQIAPPALAQSGQTSSTAVTPLTTSPLRTPLTRNVITWGKAHPQVIVVLSSVVIALSISLVGWNRFSPVATKVEDNNRKTSSNSYPPASNINEAGSDKNAAGSSSANPDNKPAESIGNTTKPAAHLVWKKNFRKHRGVTWAVALSPNGRTAASGGEDKVVRLWDTKEERLLRGHTSDVTSIAFSPDGETLASSSNDKTILLWEKKNDYREPKRLTAHSDEVKTVAFSPKGNFLVSAGKDRSVILWDLQWRPQQRLMHNAEVMAIAFSPDGNTLASASKDGTIKIWDLQQLRSRNFSDLLTGRESRVVCSQCGEVYALAFSCDGEILASGGSDNQIWLWNWRSGQKPTALGKHTAYITSLAFSPDCKSLVSASNDRTVRVWDFQRPGALQPEAEQVLKQEARVTWLSFSPKGTLISGSYDGRVKLWQLESK